MVCLKWSKASIVSIKPFMLMGYEMQYFFELITCDPSIYLMDPDFIECSCMEKSIGLKRGKGEYCVN